MKQIKSLPEFQELINSGKKVVIDFYADWCGPCKMMAPFFEEVAQETSDVEFAKVNVDDLEALAQEYQIASIPTLLVFKQGKLIKRNAGFMPKDALVDFVKD